MPTSARRPGGGCSIAWMRPETEAVLCSGDPPAAMALIAAQRGWPLLISHDPDGRFSQAAGFWADGGTAPGAPSYIRHEGGVALRGRTAFPFQERFGPLCQLLSLLGDGIEAA